MSARNEDFLFAQEAQAKGYVTEAQIEEAFELQRRMADDLRIDERLAVILVKRGWMGEEQARRIYAVLEPQGKEARIEGYRLVQKVGRGAMGTVYKAIHEGLHRVVAIKVLRRELVGDRIHTERLKREAQMLADLDHPNIVRAMDAGESNGFPYVVMEYVEGESVKERLAREGPFDEDKALAITRDLADALERARRMGVVHRDVKPGNVLLDRKDTPKLMDLGLAKGPVDTELTQHGATVGTPQFMSPEQAQEAGRADTRSDIYSLGASLYAMLTGRPPHSGSSMAEIITKVLYRQPVPIRALNDDVSPEVSYLVERMMLKDPTLRYQTPAEVVEDIDRITGGRSIVPQGFTGNWEAWLLRQRIRKRNRLLTWSTVAVLLVALAGWKVWSVQRRSDVDTRIATWMDELLTLDRSDTARSRAWQVKLKRGRSLVEQMRVEAARVDEDVPEAARAHRDLLQLHDEALSRWETVRAEAEALRQQGQFQRALVKARGVPVAEGLPLGRVQETYHQGIETASRTAWNDLLARHRRQRPATMADLAAHLDETAKALAHPRFTVGDAPRRQASEDAARLHGQVDAIAASLERHEATWPASRIHTAVDGNQAHALARDLAQARRTVEQAVSAFTADEAWFQAEGRFRLEDLVGPRLEAVDAPLLQRIVKRWQDLAAQEDEVADPAPLLDAVEAFLRSLELGELATSLQPEVSSLVQRLRDRKRSLVEARERIQAEAVSQVLAAARAGRPAEIRRHVAEALERAVGDPALRPVLAPLEELAAGVELLHTRARATLKRLEGDRRPQTVLLASEDPATGAPRQIEGWVLIEATDGEIISRAGRSREVTSRTLADYHLRQRLAWAQAQEPLPRPVASLLRWSLLPTGSWKRQGDLRQAVEAYKRLGDDLRAWDAPRVWQDVARRWEAEVRAEQSDREDLAADAFVEIAHRQHKGDWVGAVDLAQLFLDPTSRTWWTNVREAREANVRATLSVALREVQNNRLLRLFRGARVEEDREGVATVEVDFSVPEALRLFPNGFAQLVDEDGSRPNVTPREASPVRDRRLRLLPGVEGLLRQHPLALESPFDPARPITVEFDLYTLTGCFLLGVDIDGVQVAVWSGDPAWHPEWTLPEGLSDDPADNPVAWAGRGRGVASSHGKGFGHLDDERWTWSDKHLARHHDAWRKEDDLGRGDERFAFRPGRSYRVRVVRTRDRVQLFVADRAWRAGAPVADADYVLVLDHQKPAFGRTARTSDLAPEMRRNNGSGRLQILSWTTVEIDNLALQGTIRPSWREARERDLSEAPK